MKKLPRKIGTEKEFSLYFQKGIDFITSFLGLCTVLFVVYSICSVYPILTLILGVLVILSFPLGYCIVKLEKKDN